MQFNFLLLIAVWQICQKSCTAFQHFKRAFPQKANLNFILSMGQAQYTSLSLSHNGISFSSC